MIITLSHWLVATDGAAAPLQVATSASRCSTPGLRTGVEMMLFKLLFKKTQKVEFFFVFWILFFAHKFFYGFVIISLL